MFLQPKNPPFSWTLLQAQFCSKKLVRPRRTMIPNCNSIGEGKIMLVWFRNLQSNQSSDLVSINRGTISIEVDKGWKRMKNDEKKTKNTLKFKCTATRRKEWRCKSGHACSNRTSCPPRFLPHHPSYSGCLARRNVPSFGTRSANWTLFPMIRLRQWRLLLTSSLPSLQPSRRLRRHRCHYCPQRPR